MANSVLERAGPRFSLVAHAMGGFVAFEILRRARERVKRLALLSTLASADTPKQTERREGYLRLIEQGQFAQIIEERIPMLLHPAHAKDVALCSVLRRMAAETGVDGFRRQQRAIMSRPDSRPSLVQIPCETLVLFGRADGITTIDHQVELRNGIPHARLEVIEDCGHMLTLEKPAAVAEALQLFLA